MKEKKPGDKSPRYPILSQRTVGRYFDEDVNTRNNNVGTGVSAQQAADGISNVQNQVINNDFVQAEDGAQFGYGYGNGGYSVNNPFVRPSYSPLRYNSRGRIKVQQAAVGIGNVQSQGINNGFLQGEDVGQFGRSYISNPFVTPSYSPLQYSSGLNNARGGIRAQQDAVGLANIQTQDINPGFLGGEGFGKFGFGTWGRIKAQQSAEGTGNVQSQSINRGVRYDETVDAGLGYGDGISNPSLLPVYNPGGGIQAQQAAQGIGNVQSQSALNDEYADAPFAYGNVGGGIRAQQAAQGTGNVQSQSVNRGVLSDEDVDPRFGYGFGGYGAEGGIKAQQAAQGTGNVQSQSINRGISYDENVDAGLGYGNGGYGISNPFVTPGYNPGGGVQAQQAAQGIGNVQSQSVLHDEDVDPRLGYGYGGYSAGSGIRAQQAAQGTGNVQSQGINRAIRYDENVDAGLGFANGGYGITNPFLTPAYSPGGGVQAQQAAQGIGNVQSQGVLHDEDVDPRLGYGYGGYSAGGGIRAQQAAQGTGNAQSQAINRGIRYDENVDVGLGFANGGYGISNPFLTPAYSPVGGVQAQQAAQGVGNVQSQNVLSDEDVDLRLGYGYGGYSAGSGIRAQQAAQGTGNAQSQAINRGIRYDENVDAGLGFANGGYGISNPFLTPAYSPVGGVQAQQAAQGIGNVQSQGVLHDEDVDPRLGYGYGGYSAGGGIRAQQAAQGTGNAQSQAINRGIRYDENVDVGLGFANGGYGISNPFLTPAYSPVVGVQAQQAAQGIGNVQSQGVLHDEDVDPRLGYGYGGYSAGNGIRAQQAAQGTGNAQSQSINRGIRYDENVDAGLGFANDGYGVSNPFLTPAYSQGGGVQAQQAALGIGNVQSQNVLQDEEVDPRLGYGYGGSAGGGIRAQQAAQGTGNAQSQSINRGIRYDENVDAGLGFANSGYGISNPFLTPPYSPGGGVQAQQAAQGIGNVQSQGVLHDEDVDLRLGYGYGGYSAGSGIRAQQAAQGTGNVQSQGINRGIRYDENIDVGLGFANGGYGVNNPFLTPAYNPEGGVQAQQAAQGIGNVQSQNVLNDEDVDPRLGYGYGGYSAGSGIRAQQAAQGTGNVQSQGINRGIRYDENVDAGLGFANGGYGISNPFLTPAYNPGGGVQEQQAAQGIGNVQGQNVLQDEEVDPRLGYGYGGYSAGSGIRVQQAAQGSGNVQRQGVNRGIRNDEDIDAGLGFANGGYGVSNPFLTPAYNPEGGVQAQQAAQGIGNVQGQNILSDEDVYPRLGYGYGGYSAGGGIGAQQAAQGTGNVQSQGINRGIRYDENVDAGLGFASGGYGISNPFLTPTYNQGGGVQAQQAAQGIGNVQSQSVLHDEDVDPRFGYGYGGYSTGGGIGAQQAAQGIGNVQSQGINRGIRYDENVDAGLGFANGGYGISNPFLTPAYNPEGGVQAQQAAQGIGNVQGQSVLHDEDVDPRLGYGYGGYSTGGGIGAQQAAQGIGNVQSQGINRGIRYDENVDAGLGFANGGYGISNPFLTPAYSPGGGVQAQQAARGVGNVQSQNVLNDEDLDPRLGFGYGGYGIEGGIKAQQAAQGARNAQSQSINRGTHYDENIDVGLGYGNGGYGISNPFLTPAYNMGGGVQAQQAAQGIGNVQDQNVLNDEDVDPRLGYGYSAGGGINAQQAAQGIGNVQSQRVLNDENAYAPFAYGNDGFGVSNPFLVPAYNPGGGIRAQQAAQGTSNVQSQSVNRGVFSDEDVDPRFGYGYVGYGVGVGVKSQQGVHGTGNVQSQSINRGIRYDENVDAGFGYGNGGYGITNPFLTPAYNPGDGVQAQQAAQGTGNVQSQNVLHDEDADPRFGYGYGGGDGIRAQQAAQGTGNVQSQGINRGIHYDEVVDAGLGYGNGGYGISNPFLTPAYNPIDGVQAQQAAQGTGNVQSQNVLHDEDVDPRFAYEFGSYTPGGGIKAQQAVQGTGNVQGQKIMFNRGVRYDENIGPQLGYNNEGYGVSNPFLTPAYSPGGGIVQSQGMLHDEDVNPRLGYGYGIEGGIRAQQAAQGTGNVQDQVINRGVLHDEDAYARYYTPGYGQPMYGMLNNPGGGIKAQQAAVGTGNVQDQKVIGSYSNTGYISNPFLRPGPRLTVLPSAYDYNAAYDINNRFRTPAYYQPEYHDISNARQGIAYGYNIYGYDASNHNTYDPLPSPNYDLLRPYGFNNMGYISNPFSSYDISNTRQSVGHGIFQDAGSNVGYDTSNPHYGHRHTGYTINNPFRYRNYPRFTLGYSNVGYANYRPRYGGDINSNYNRFLVQRETERIPSIIPIGVANYGYLGNRGLVESYGSQRLARSILQNENSYLRSPNGLNNVNPFYGRLGYGNNFNDAKNGIQVQQAAVGVGNVQNQSIFHDEDQRFGYGYGGFGNDLIKVQQAARGTGNVQSQSVNNGALHDEPNYGMNSGIKAQQAARGVGNVQNQAVNKGMFQDKSKFGFGYGYGANNNGVQAQQAAPAVGHVQSQSVNNGNFPEGGQSSPLGFGLGVSNNNFRIKTQQAVQGVGYTQIQGINGGGTFLNENRNPPFGLGYGLNGGNSGIKAQQAARGVGIVQGQNVNRGSAFSDENRNSPFGFGYGLNNVNSGIKAQQAAEGVGNVQDQNVNGGSQNPLFGRGYGANSDVGAQQAAKGVGNVQDQNVMGGGTSDSGIKAQQAAQGVGNVQSQGVNNGPMQDEHSQTGSGPNFTDDIKAQQAAQGVGNVQSQTINKGPSHDENTRPELMPPLSDENNPQTDSNADADPRFGPRRSPRSGPMRTQQASQGIGNVQNQTVNIRKSKASSQNDEVENRIRNVNTNINIGGSIKNTNEPVYMQQFGHATGGGGDGQPGNAQQQSYNKYG